MSDKVLPFRSIQDKQPPNGPTPPDGATKKPRLRRVQRRGLLLVESGEFDGYSTLDLVNGLHGVCNALDQLEGSARSLDQVAELSMAAKVLSSILQNRVELH